jgi:hypothetical protein
MVRQMGNGLLAAHAARLQLPFRRNLQESIILTPTVLHAAVGALDRLVQVHFEKYLRLQGNPGGDILSRYWAADQDFRHISSEVMRSLNKIGRACEQVRPDSSQVKLGGERFRILNRSFLFLFTSYCCC